MSVWIEDKIVSGTSSFVVSYFILYYINRLSFISILVFLFFFSCVHVCYRKKIFDISVELSLTKVSNLFVGSIFISTISFVKSFWLIKVLAIFVFLKEWFYSLSRILWKWFSTNIWIRWFFVFLFFWEVFVLAEWLYCIGSIGVIG